MAKIPSIPPRSAKPLGPRIGGAASEPITEIFLGFLSGSAHPVFFKRTILAVAISRTIFQWSSRTSMCLFRVSFKGSQALKLVSGYPESWPTKYHPARILGMVYVSKRKGKRVLQNAYRVAISSTRASGMVPLLT